MDEIPDLVRVSRRFGDSVVVVGLSTDLRRGGREAVRTFVRRNQIPYPNYMATIEMVSAVGDFQFIPHTLVIDRQGEIVRTFEGKQDEETFVRALTPLL